MERTRNRKVFVPKVDIIETGNAMVMYADMPGTDEKSVEITLEKNVLTITGTVQPQAFPGRSIAYSEYDVGDYERAFTLSDEVDRQKIGAVVKNGVLKLTLQKAPQAEVRKIAVRTE
jgi:HSP20 family molecular chaperone IbpA